MKKIVLSVLFILIGFVYVNAETAAVSPELAAARAKYDTPFTKKYRPRYEANDINFGFIRNNAINECREKCSKKNIEMIENLAKYGDMFALVVLPSMLTNIEDIDYVEKHLELALASANKGEPYNMLTIASEYKRKNMPEAIKYATLVKEKGLIGGYRMLSYLYASNRDTKNFCAISQEGYKKYGIEFLASSIISPKSPNSEFFFSNCIKQKPEEIIVISGAEGILINGYVLVGQKNYEDAYKAFAKLYKEKNGSKLSANAGYCLGIMNYYGKGVKKNKEIGLQLLKEAFDNGVVYLDAPGQEKFALPPKFEIISYAGGNCNSIQ